MNSEQLSSSDIILSPLKCTMWLRNFEVGPFSVNLDFEQVTIEVAHFLQLSAIRNFDESLGSMPKNTTGEMPVLRATRAVGYSCSSSRSNSAVARKTTADSCSPVLNTPCNDSSNLFINHSLPGHIMWRWSAGDLLSFEAIAFWSATVLSFECNTTSQSLPPCSLVHDISNSKFKSDVNRYFDKVTKTFKGVTPASGLHFFAETPQPMLPREATTKK